MGIISNLFLRAYKICSCDKIDQEIEYLKNAFGKLGYGNDFVNKGHLRARRTFYDISQRTEFIKENESIVVIPQTNGNNALLKKHLKDCNVIAVFRNDNTIKKATSCFRQHPSDNSPCIYKVPCTECDEFYIGETIDLQRRKREHRDSIRKGDNNSAVFRHLRDNNHPINIDHTIEISHITNTEKRKLTESILIQNSNNFNIHQSNYKLDNFPNSILNYYVTRMNKLVKHVNRPPDRIT